MGTLVLKVEHGVKVVDAGALEFCGDSVTVRGEGSSVMAEWSQPTLVACVRALEHLKTQYGLFGHHGNKETESSDKGGVTDSEVTKRESWIKKLPRVDLELTLTDINVFLYALTPGGCVPCACRGIVPRPLSHSQLELLIVFFCVLYMLYVLASPPKIKLCVHPVCVCLLSVCIVSSIDNVFDQFL